MKKVQNGILTIGVFITTPYNKVKERSYDRPFEYISFIYTSNDEKINGWLLIM
jgi:hypothetical protein